MSTELVKYNKEMQSSVDGLQMSTNELVVPRLTLVQPTSQNSKDMGKFLFNMTNQTFDKIKVVFFKTSLGRVMFDPVGMKIALCGSPDRISPSARMEKPKALRCVECKYHRRGYRELIPGTENKPKYFQCDETVMFLGCLIDEIFPFTFTTRRSANGPASTFLTSLNFQGQSYSLKNKERPSLHWYITELSSDIPKNAQTKYYIPIFNQIGMDKDNEFINAIAEMLKDYSFDRTFEEEDIIKEGPELNPDEGV